MLSSTIIEEIDNEDEVISTMTDQPIMMTIDVEGDWGGSEARAIIEVLPPLLDLFNRYHVRATFFVVADLIDQVGRWLPPGCGHEVGSHGLTHSVLTRLSEDEVVAEVTESKRILEKRGYSVHGFRAPFFLAPGQLPQLLADSGYEYDASCGSVYPSLLPQRTGQLLWQTNPQIRRIETSTLKDRRTPFSLTYLRMLHPLGLRLVSQRSRLFFFHLHELLENSGGWQRMPLFVRHLHMRNSGRVAWRLLEEVLKRFQNRFVTCKEFTQRTVL